MTFLLSFTPIPFGKGTYSKRKAFPPREKANSFLLDDPFSEGRQNKFDSVVSPEKVSLNLTGKTTETTI